MLTGEQAASVKKRKAKAGNFKERIGTSMTNGIKIF